jgi:serine/threonine protein kinase
VVRQQVELHQALGDSTTSTVPDHADAAVEPTPPALPGYEVLAFLGRGGMGVVYKARQRNLNRLVALKTLADRAATADQRQRFRAEAEAMARLQHANVVQVFDVGDQAGCPYFAMELVDGFSLERLLADGPLSPSRAAELVETLAGRSNTPISAA